MGGGYGALLGTKLIANFLQYEYLNSSFITHYFLIPFFSKPLLPNCSSLPTKLIANKVYIYKPC